MSRTEFSHGVVKICQILKYMYLFSVVVQFLWLLLQYTWLLKLLQTKSPRKVRIKYVDKTLKNCIIIYSPIKIFSSLIGIKVL